MAGAGFRTFVDGEVLTAAQVNTYLMQQSVMVFADASARSTAIAAPSEGMVTYLTGSDVLEYYDGAAWQPILDQDVIAAKGDLIVGTADDTVQALTVGSDEQRLVADSGEITGLKYVADTTNYAIGAKGDLLVGTAADTVTNLAVGTNGQVLTADSAEASGLKWAAAAAGTAMTSLATGSLTSGTSFDLTSISGAYESLELWIYGLACASDFSLTARFNNDSTTNYRATSTFGTTTIGTANRTTLYMGETTDADGIASYRLFLPMYSKTGTSKICTFHCIGRNASTASDRTLINGTFEVWYSTDAINRITVTSSQTFTAGTYVLWGIK